MEININNTVVDAIIKLLFSMALFTEKRIQRLSVLSVYVELSIFIFTSPNKLKTSSMNTIINNSTRINKNLQLILNDNNKSLTRFQLSLFFNILNFSDLLIKSNFGNGKLVYFENLFPIILSNLI